MERLRKNVHDECWDRKLTYFQVLFALGANWDKAAGRREIKKLEPFDDETDVEILQLYIDLCGGDLSFSSTQAIIDRIVTFTSEIIERLHYRCLRAINCFLIGAQEKASVEAVEAIEEYRAARVAAKETTYERHVFGESLALLASIMQDATFLDEALAVHLDVLDAEDLNSRGQALVQRNIGDLYRDKGDYLLAVEWYLQATDLERVDIVEVFLSQCYFELGELDNAVESIERVDREQLGAAAKFDYALAFGAIATGSGDPQLLDRAKVLLGEVGEAAAPYFRQRRDSMLVSVVETQISGRSESMTHKARQVLKSAATAMARYLVLQPNFMGLGIDVGKVLDDLRTGPAKHSHGSCDSGKKEGRG